MGAAADGAVWILYLVDKVKFEVIREADRSLLTLILSSELIKQVNKQNQTLCSHYRLIYERIILLLKQRM